jgi:hypothetical protein
VATYLICHRHEAAECRFAYAAWKGVDSPLRHRAAMSSCAKGGHELWWTLEAPDGPAALAQLPPFIAERSDATEVSEVLIP